MTPGERLYRLWLGDPEGKTDRARYFASMNPAARRRWEELAARLLDGPYMLAGAIEAEE